MKRVSIIYSTCDAYESLWPGFFTLLDRYWPDCRQDILLNTETKSFSTELSLSIRRPDHIRPDCSWSQRLLDTLESVKTPYVLLILDDFYLKSPVRLEKLNRCVNRMDSDPRIGLFTFAPQPGPNHLDPEDPDFERRGRWATYRINAQIGLWRVSYLRSILKTYESPWQFELNGSFRSSVMGGKIYALRKGAAPVFDYDGGFLIARGKVNEPLAIYFREQEGLDMDLPFPTFVESEYEPPAGSRILRMMKYGWEMVCSLFRQ